MSTCKEHLMLEKDIAGVRLEEHKLENGVVVLIPAGEVVRVDRTVPLVDRMLPVEWNGSSYGVFSQDLRERADKVGGHRESNPGIVEIHPK
jgi:hypothetical protein